MYAICQVSKICVSFVVVKYFVRLCVGKGCKAVDYPDNPSLVHVLTPCYHLDAAKGCQSLCL